MDGVTLEPPPRYLPLEKVEQQPLSSSVSIIGVVVDLLPPAPTKGTDFQCSFSLQDPSILGSHHSSSGVRMKMFRRAEKCPQHLAVGDIVMIRGARLSTFSGNKLLVDFNGRAEFLFFAPKSIPDPAFNAAHIGVDYEILNFTTLPNEKTQPPTAEEQAYIIKLSEWAKRHADILPQPNEHQIAGISHIPSGPRALAGVGTAVRSAAQDQKFCLVGDIVTGRFHDLAGEVVKMWDDRGRVDLYITDYTYNPALFDYRDAPPLAEGLGRDGDEYGYTSNFQPPTKKEWDGPSGKHTILIALWGPQAIEANRNFNVGDVVYLRNVRTFITRNNNLEGALHEDQKHPDQVNIRRLERNSLLFKELALRKEEYWKSKEKKPGTKTQKAQKRKAKKNKKSKGQEKDDQQNLIDGRDSMENDGSLFVRDSRDTLNEKVVTANSDKSFLTLTQIMSTQHRHYRGKDGKEMVLPFVNQNSRSKVRVIDYYPPNIEDFVASPDDSEYHDMEENASSSSILEYSSLRPTGWEWRFYLRVEDARPVPGQPPTRINLLVQGKDAEFLLNLKATDLTMNLEILDQLKRKLWTLWGDVEELKTGGEDMEVVKPNNHPFECLIREYGVETAPGDWQQMHRMFYTKIRA